MLACLLNVILRENPSLIGAEVAGDKASIPKEALSRFLLDELPALSQLLPYASEKELEDALSKLEEAGIIVRSNSNITVTSLETLQEACASEAGPETEYALNHLRYAIRLQPI